MSGMNKKKPTTKTEICVKLKKYSLDNIAISAKVNITAGIACPNNALSCIAEFIMTLASYKCFFSN